MISDATIVLSQIKNNWEILFDGKDLDKWQTNSGKEVRSDSWEVKEGVLSLKPNDKGKGTGRDINTKEKYENFELILSFKLTNRANTGVKYLVNPLKDKKGNQMMVGIEYQLIDDIDYPAPAEYKTPEGLTGAVYSFYPTNKKKKFAVYDWNTIKIVKKNRHIEHWLNGKKIVSYEIGSPDYLEKLAKNKFNQYSDLANVNSGCISLQDHGDLVYFKDIKIRRLKY
ncbi:3-keto-disaccharide hydrolase [Pseudopedobacter beijingensis]|uniref:DUF1080 domain-containing protein n=1 Tax=Pseudopedobacter beijingensis TaxID=1207056 RepID=A0ABW4IGY9_9SPHI